MAIRDKLSKLALFTASLAVSLLIAEGLVRILNLDTYTYHAFSGFTRRDEVLGWDLVPGRTGVFKGRHFETRVEISPQGLRDRVYPLERADNRRRILVLGDSVVWCWGVDMEDCFTEILEGWLEQTDVIALGVPGYGTAQELLVYERRGRDFRPDMVVLVFVGNDPDDNVSDERPLFRRVGDDLVLTNVPLSSSKSRVKEWLQEHSRLYAQVNYVIQVVKQMKKEREREDGRERKRKEDRFVTSPEPGTGESWDLTRAILDRLGREVARDGACFAIFFVGKSDETSATLEEYCASRGIPLLQAAPRLRKARAEGVRTRLRGDPHFARAGQEILAETVLDFLQSDRPAGCLDPAVAVGRRAGTGAGGP